PPKRRSIRHQWTRSLRGRKPGQLAIKKTANSGTVVDGSRGQCVSRCYQGGGLDQRATYRSGSHSHQGNNTRRQPGSNRVKQARSRKRSNAAYTGQDNLRAGNSEGTQDRVNIHANQRTESRRTYQGEGTGGVRAIPRRGPYPSRGRV
ncbi:hypothetical protein HDU80_006284, partial [Chytriomyces hyalinus]